jgi:hypothetical protein
MNKFLKRGIRRISDAATALLDNSEGTLDAKIEIACCAVLDQDDGMSLKLAMAEEKCEATQKLVVSPVFDKDLGFKGWVMATKTTNTRVAEFATFAEMDECVVQAAIGRATPEFRMAVKSACSKTS